jgi:hypothetical protein
MGRGAGQALVVGVTMLAVWLSPVALAAAATPSTCPTGGVSGTSSQHPPGGPTGGIGSTSENRLPTTGADVTHEHTVAFVALALGVGIVTTARRLR